MLRARLTEIMMSVQLPAERLQALLRALRESFRCGAVALLQCEGDQLRPVAIDGLVAETLGRRFVVAQHPRLAAILARPGLTGFDRDSTLPDPYDGLLDSLIGEPLPVHDCLGLQLSIDGQTWGALTLDALRTGTFDAATREALRREHRLIEAIIRLARLEQENETLKLARSPLGQDPGGALPDRDATELVADSPPMRQLLRELEVVAASDLPVLLLGETGVGKDVLARVLHQRSARAARALVHVNCAALPESLAESELFGHVRGAYSGATEDRPGRFEAADGGTLLLDEVGELPLPIQAKLLRALQNGEIQRLGSDRTLRVDVRLVAATNRNLREAVRDGSFRADLYHRLSVYPLPVPPLRERPQDIPLLAGRFLELNRARFGLRSVRLAPEAQDALLRYRWPGNIRELEHVLSRAVLKSVSRGASRSEIISVPPELLDIDVTPLSGGGAELAAAVRAAAGPDAAWPTLRDISEQARREHIRATLQRCQGNWNEAARRLGVDPSNLHKLARRIGVKSDATNASGRGRRR
jgi:anaerobic nitric oxide reductase transcription regulator